MKFCNSMRCALKPSFLYFHVIVRSTLAVDFQKFTRWGFDNIRIDNVDATFDNITLLQCALICEQNQRCVSFNIHPSGTCEINTKPFDFYTNAYLNQPSWRLYEKGDCGLGIETSKHCLMIPKLLYDEYGSSGLSWVASKDACMKGQAILVKVADETEMQELNNELNNIFSNFGDWSALLWTGLNKIERADDDFVWDDMTAPLYTNFTSSEPDTTHDCVVMTNFQSVWVWKTFSCLYPLTYVCERRNVK